MHNSGIRVRGRMGSAPWILADRPAWLEKLLCPAVSFAATALALCVGYAAFGLYPFGKGTLAWCDMSQQVVPLLLEFRDICFGEAGTFLNLQNAGGMSFWGVFFFFLASPFHLLVLFIEKSQVYQLVNVLVLLKLALAAATASWFFRREAPRLANPALVSLGIAYGLCGYGLMYYQNLVWLDMLYLFPVVMLGFVRLVEEGKSGLFTTALALSVVVNYYLSYMLFLGLILAGAAFIWRCVPKEQRGPAAGRLGLAALTALLLTAVVWVPSLGQCLASARTGGGVVESIQNGGLWTDLATTLPVLLCSVGAAALPLVRWMFPTTPKRRAIAVCWTATLLPMFLEPVNKLWHTGSYQAFPVRYGYMTVFFGLWYLAQGLNFPEEKPFCPGRRWGLLCVGALLLPAGVGIWLLSTRFEELCSYTSSLWVSKESFGLLALFWAACIAALAVSCLAFRRARRRLAGWAMLGLCLIQGAVQIPVFIGSAANVPTTSLAVLETRPLEDQGLYRVKPATKFFPVNLLGATGCPTLSHYTSLTDERFLYAMKKLGYSAYWMENSGSGGTVVGDILLSNKYALNRDLCWEATGSGNIGYLIPAGALPETLELGDRLLLQNQLCRLLYGKEPFQRYAPLAGEPEKQDGKYSLKPESLRYEIRVGQRETLYFDGFDQVSTKLREAVNDGFSIRVNGEELAGRYPTQSNNGILCLGSFERQTVTVEVEIHKEMEVRSFGVWGLKAKAAEELAAALPNASLRQEGDMLAGNVQAEKGQALFLSVPWYQGTEIWVNGQKTHPRVVMDCFWEVPLPEGSSKIEIRYFPKGMALGMALSAAGILLLAAGAFFRRAKLFSWIKTAWLRLAPGILKLAAAGVVLAVYVLPVAVWLASV